MLEVLSGRVSERVDVLRKDVLQQVHDDGDARRKVRLKQSVLVLLVLSTFKRRSVLTEILWFRPQHTL